MHADIKDAGNTVGSAFRKGSEGCRLAARRRQRNRIADPRTGLEGHALADQDAALVPEAGYGGIVERFPERPARGKVRPADTADDRADIDRATGHHGLPLDLRGDRDDAGNFGNLQRQRVEIGNAAPLGGVDTDMAVQPEDATDEFGPEPVHHRHHDDQRRDAKRDAGKREPGDDRDESLGPARAHVAHGQKPLDGRKQPHQCPFIALVVAPQSGTRPVPWSAVLQ